MVVPYKDSILFELSKFTYNQNMEEKRPV